MCGENGGARSLLYPIIDLNNSNSGSILNALDLLTIQYPTTAAPWPSSLSLLTLISPSI
jgi:hypothetical protein